MLSRWIASGTNFANTTITASGGAKFSTVENDLQVQVIPSALLKHAFQVALCFVDIAPACESPALCQTVYVRIDRKAWDAERLRHHNACCFMSYAWKLFEALEVLGDFAAMIFDQDFT